MSEQQSLFGEMPAPEVYQNGDELELGCDFNYEGFQVVRREFFAHINEPSITFCDCQVYVNTACLHRFPSVTYVQVLVNSDTMILAVRPCKEEERDTFAWCVPGSKKRTPRHVTCRLLFAKLFSLMNWNTDYRYKLLGKVIHAKQEHLIAFDLTATEVYQRAFKPGETPKNTRTPIFPESWQNQFGMPFQEHRTSMQVNIFEGYAVYSLQESSGGTPAPGDRTAPPIDEEANDTTGGLAL